MANSIAQLLVKIGLDSSALGAGLDRDASRIRRFGDEMANAGRALSLGISVPLLGVGTVALKTAGEMEQAQVAFTTLLKSSTSATEHLAKLKSFALTTPFQFTDLTKLSRLMQAYGFSAEEVVPKLRTLGNAVSALGGGSDVLERVIRSMGEIGTRGKITGEQLRELSRAGIPALQAIADKLGVSVAEAQQKITAGTVDAKLASDALLEYMDTRFRGGMEAQSKTLLGLFSNLKDQLTFTLDAVGKSLIPLGKDLIAQFIEPALKKIRELAEEFSKLPKPVQQGAVAIAGIGAATGIAIVALGTLISNTILVASTFGKLALAIGPAAARLELFVAGLGAASTSYAAMVATGIFRAATWAGLAVSIGLAIDAILELNRARADSEKATRDLDKQVAILEVSMRQQGIDISEVSKRYAQGEFTLRQYLQRLREIAVEFRRTHPLPGQLIAGTGTLTIDNQNKEALEKLNLKSTEERRKDLADAQKYYRTLQSLGVENAQVLAEAARRVQDAQEALNGTTEISIGRARDFRKEYERVLVAYSQGKATSIELARAAALLAEQERATGSAAAETAEIWKQVFQTQGDGLKTQELHIESLRKLGKEVRETRKAVTDQNQAYHDATLVQLGMAQGLSEARLRAALAVIAFEGLQEEVDAGRLGFDKTKTSALQLARSLDETGTSAHTAAEGVSDMARQTAVSIKDLPFSVQAAATSILKFTGPVETAFQKAAATLRLSIEEISGEVTNKTVEAFNVIARSAQNIDQVEAAWASASQVIRRLARADVPAATQAFQTYIQALKDTGATEQRLAQRTVEFQELRIRAAQEAGQKIAASEFILLDVMRRRLEQMQFNWGQFVTNVLARFESGAASALSRDTTSAILQGGIVDQRKLDANVKSAQEAFDAIREQAEKSADQQQEVLAAYYAWQAAQKRLEVYRDANITAEKRQELQRQVEDTKSAYDRIRQTYISAFRGMKEATDTLKQAQDAARDPSPWARFSGTVITLLKDIGKVALEVFVEEISRIAISRLISALEGLIFRGIKKTIGEWVAFGVAGKTASTVVADGLKKVASRLDDITIKGAIATGTLTSMATAATAGIERMNIALSKTLERLLEIIGAAIAAGAALRWMAAANVGFGRGGNDFFAPIFGGGGFGGSREDLPPWLSDNPWGEIGGPGGIGSGGQLRLAATPRLASWIDAARNAAASLPQQVVGAPALVPALVPAAGGTPRLGGPGGLTINFNGGNFYGGRQGVRELSNHVFSDYRTRGRRLG